MQLFRRQGKNKNNKSCVVSTFFRLKAFLAAQKEDSGVRSLVSAVPREVWVLVLKQSPHSWRLRAMSGVFYSFQRKHTRLKTRVIHYSYHHAPGPEQLALAIHWGWGDRVFLCHVSRYAPNFSHFSRAAKKNDLVTFRWLCEHVQTCNSAYLEQTKYTFLLCCLRKKGPSLDVMKWLVTHCHFRKSHLKEFILGSMGWRTQWPGYRDAIVELCKLARITRREVWVHKGSFCRHWLCSHLPRSYD